jgi:hypothetical protein
MPNDLSEGKDSSPRSVGTCDEGDEETREEFCKAATKSGIHARRIVSPVSVSTGGGVIAIRIHVYRYTSTLNVKIIAADNSICRFML